MLLYIMCIVPFVVVVFAQRSHSQNGSRKGVYKECIKKKLVHDLFDKRRRKKRKKKDARVMYGASVF